jgi:hypothetical protein
MPSKYRSLVAVLLACIAVTGAGCKESKKGNDGEPQSKEEQWVTQFRKELDKTEQRFFQSRYIQNQADPFYLNDVFSRLTGDKTPSKALKAQIETRREDFNDSWPLLTSQMERTQAIFGLTGVLPSYYVAVALNLMGKPDSELMANINRFKDIVLGGTVFGTGKNEMDLAPKAKKEALDLAAKIGARALTLASGVLSSSQGPLKGKLETFRNEIRLLNPVAAENAGQKLAMEEIPYIENPIKLWDDLKKVYDEIFSTLSNIAKLDRLNEDLAGAKTRKQKQLLKREIDSLTTDIQTGIDGFKALQGREAELLKKLIFATEKQFNIAKKLTTDGA